MIGEAVRKVADCMQATVALVDASALSAVSAAVQTQFSVRRNRILYGPASLYFVTVAALDPGDIVDVVKALRGWEHDGTWERAASP